MNVRTYACIGQKTFLLFRISRFYFKLVFQGTKLENWKPKKHDLKTTQIFPENVQ